MRRTAPARTARGSDRVDGDCAPVMASEDFGVLADHVPACLAFLGDGATAAQGGTPLHSHDDVFDDDVLAAGVAFYVRVVLDALTG